jgi:hypothetical protein
VTTPRSRPAWPLPLLLALACAWRLAILLRTEFAIDGDEGTVGLMALHISKLREFPIFYYGQPYMGALEAYVAALPMAVFGADVVALKLTALAFALATVWLGWLVAGRVLGQVAGFFTGLYLAVPPFYLSVWSLKLRGGYTSLLALGFGILCLAHVIGTRGATRRNSFALGALAGLATWLHLLSVPIVGAAGLYLLARRALVNRFDTLASAVAGFVLGALPLLAANVASGGETIRYLSRRGRVGDSLGNPLDTLTDHLPKLLGALGPPDAEPSVSAWAVPVCALFGFALLLFVWRERSSILGFLRCSGRPTSGAELFLLVAVLYVACSVLARYGTDPSPRFALVLCLTIAPVFGALAAWGWEGRGPRTRALTAATLALLLGVHVHSLWHLFGDERGPYDATDYHPFVHGSTSANTLALLDRLGVDGLSADLFVSHALCFLSGDRIVPSPPRYAPHARRFRDAERIAWSINPLDSNALLLEPILDHLADAGVRFEPHEVDGQRIVVLVDTGHSSREWTATANLTPEWADGAIDRDPRSAWPSWRVTAEATDDTFLHLVVDLGRPLPVGRVGLVFNVGRPQHPVPRPSRLVFSTSRDGEHWDPPRMLAPGADVWSTEIAPVQARFVSLQSSAPGEIWDLVELFLFEE